MLGCCLPTSAHTGRMTGRHLGLFCLPGGGGQDRHCVHAFTLITWSPYTFMPHSPSHPVPSLPVPSPPSLPVPLASTLTSVTSFCSSPWNTAVRGLYHHTLHSCLCLPLQTSVGEGCFCAWLGGRLRFLPNSGLLWNGTGAAGRPPACFVLLPMGPLYLACHFHFFPTTTSHFPYHAHCLLPSFSSVGRNRLL